MIHNVVEPISVVRTDCADFDLSCGREWLVANGIGGFASGTVGGALTRRYHGLLVAALAPPVQRTVLVDKLEVCVRYAQRVERRVWMEHGKNTTFVELSVVRGSAPAALPPAPLCSHRDYHSLGHGGWPLDVKAVEHGCRRDARVQHRRCDAVVLRRRCRVPGRRCAGRVAE